MLPGMTDVEIVMADLWATSITTGKHPIEEVRPQLTAAGILSAERLHEAEDGTRVTVGGQVTHRQRPATASGVTFMNLEDETGMINVICSGGVFIRSKRAITSSAALMIERLPIALRSASRDWR